MSKSYERFTRLLEHFQDQGCFAQASFAVFDRQGVRARGDCGGAGLEAVFDLASLTKVFVTTALLRLTAQGRLDLNALVLPLLDVPEKSVRLRRVLAQATAASLLTHTAGLPAWYPLYAGTGSFWERLEQAIEFEGEGGRPPMVYSDLGYMLAGRLLERLSGLSLPDAVEEYVRRPLGIPVLAYLPPGADRRQLLGGRPLVVSCYGNTIEREMCRERGISFDGFRPEGQPVEGQANDGNAWYYFGGISGHAGLFSNAAGVAELGRFYLNTQEAPFLRALEEGPWGRGLGFEFGPRYPQGCGHTGFTGTSLFLSRERGVGGVLLTNRLTSPGREAKNVDPCRIAFHEAILAADEEGWL